MHVMCSVELRIARRNSFWKFLLGGRQSDPAGLLGQQNQEGFVCLVGGCGRCFEVRCKSGPIKLDYEHLMPRLGSLYLPDVAPSLLDPEGRPWPGVPEAEDQTIFWTACRNESKSIVVTTIDSCPCKYIGGRNQSVCCGPIDHLDLSYWAFNKLAHPLYGKMMLEYR